MNVSHPQFLTLENISDGLKHKLSNCIVITGGIASGKTSVTKLLQEQYPVILADELVAHLYKDPLFVEQVLVLLDLPPHSSKKDIRDCVFNDYKKLDKAELFMLPKVVELIEQRAPDGVWFLEGAQLPKFFDKKLFRQTWCIYCSPDEQMKRLLARDKINIDLAKLIMQRQGDYRPFADVIIDTTYPYVEVVRSLLTQLNGV